ncbi:hypothetical protein [Aerococcus urinae]|uniref:hypothetical protein n=1 Tax=Aerococcus urinae TaxID=1376 RepID=UPI00254DD93A|nr:hypothetical protein [Aerococcus urinae]MDK7716050.1 hypothetical protein [Aerococcus urinae]
MQNQEELSPVERRLLRVLPRGEQNARTWQELRPVIPQIGSRRGFCDLVKALRGKGYPIGANRGKPPGYYYCETEEEKQKVVAVYLAQAKSEYKIAKKLLHAEI